MDLSKRENLYLSEKDAEPYIDKRVLDEARYISEVTSADLKDVIAEIEDYLNDTYADYLLWETDGNDNLILDIVGLEIFFKNTVQTIIDYFNSRKEDSDNV